MMKVEYCTLPEANYMMLKSGTKADGSEALKLREIKYFTIDNPEIVRNAMKLIRPKSKWLMGVGVVRGTEIRDESGNIWDMAIREERIYVAIRPSPTSFTTASFGFETNNDFAHYLRNIAFEIEKKTNPNIKLERVGLPYFQFGVSPSKRAVCPQKKGTNHLV